MRSEDPAGIDFSTLRGPRAQVEARVMLELGHLLIPRSHMAVGAIVTSTVVVTVFCKEETRGGLCHYAYPRPRSGAPATPMYGLPALAALLQGFVDAGPSLRVGLYGGAHPEWADRSQRALARGNVEIAQQVMQRKGIPITELDVGGTSGRKLLFLTGTTWTA